MTALAIGCVMLGLGIFCWPLVLLVEGISQQILEGENDD